MWFKEGSFQRDFTTKYAPTCIAATGDNRLLIPSWASHTVMVYTLGGQPVHEFRGHGSDPEKFNVPDGICIDDREAVYVGADVGNSCVQVSDLLRFWTLPTCCILYEQWLLAKLHQHARFCYTHIA